MEYHLVVWWLLAYAALAALGYPLAARLFRRLPTRGVGFALPVSLAVLTTVGYWVGQLRFGRGTLWVGLLALAALSAAVGLDRDALRERRVALAPDLSSDRPAAVDAAVVFVAAFLLVVAVRAADPAVSALGGEKFLDYGLLRALLRAESLPPESMWFAGEPVRYYYGGHLATALLAMLTATGPDFAYNLALAGFYGALVAAAFDLSGAIAAARGGSRRLAGLLGALFVGLGGNLVTAGQLLAGLLPGGLGASLAGWMAAGTRLDVDRIAEGVHGFWYWTASRVVPGTINEFPMFAWLNGDLHAHMMGTPFLLLGVALAYAYYLAPEKNLRERRLLLFLALPVLGGSQVPLDTWSVPTIAGVTWLALVFAPTHPLSAIPGGVDAERRVRDALGGGPAAAELLRPVAALLVAGVVGALSFAIGAPFLLSATNGQELALVSAAERSGLTALLLVHGAFLALFLGLLLSRVAGDEPWLPLAGVLAFGVAAVASDLAVLAVTGPLLLLGWVGRRAGRDLGFETVLVVGGAGLVTLVEFVFVAEQAGPGRMNTVFKVYFQVWVLWGVAAAAAAADLLRSPPLVAGRWPRAELRRPLAAAFVALLVVATVPYAPLALGAHFDRYDAGTLNATAFVEEEHPGEAAAIRWLDRNAEPDDVLLSAPGTSADPAGVAENPREPGMYSWDSSPAASLTGVPTVAGWAHEVGYRGADAYYGRAADVDRAYAGSPEERRAVLERYDVTYVWVGPAERKRYGEVDLSEDPTLEVAFETSDVTVYRVVDTE